MIVGLLAALALQATSPAQGDSKGQPPAKGQSAKQGQAQADDDPNKQVCRRQAPVGSTIERRVCKTKAEWDAEAEQAKTYSDQTDLAGHSTK